MNKSLTLYFVVEDHLQGLGVYLAATIREYLDPATKIIGYCSAHKYDDLHPGLLTAFDRMGCEVRTFDAIDKWREPYPHGNKILASLEPRDTDYSGFMDTDILFIGENDLQPFLKPDKVSVVPATSMGWADQAIWTDVYGACDMPVPDDRMAMLRRKKPKVLPYFNAGVIYYPQQHRNAAGMNFPEVWRETATRVDAVDAVPRRRPYLDQLTLPVAIRRAGLDWNVMPEGQNFCLGGRMKYRPLPEHADVRALHYRYWAFAVYLNHHRTARQALWKQAGAGRIEQMESSAWPPNEAGAN